MVGSTVFVEDEGAYKNELIERFSERYFSIKGSPWKIWVEAARLKQLVVAVKDKIVTKKSKSRNDDLQFVLEIITWYGWYREFSYLVFFAEVALQ